MWLMFSNCFLSIVRKDCGAAELLVRARQRGDIEPMFPSAKVTEDTTTDYLYRVKRNIFVSGAGRKVSDLPGPGKSPLTAVVKCDPIHL